MRMMTKLLTTTLLGSATFWACTVDRLPEQTADHAGNLYGSGTEDGPGSGSDPQPDPEPEPGPESCTVDGGPTQEQLDQAKEKLQGYLGKCKGKAAVDKIMEENDKNKDGKIDKTELLAFLKKIGLGNWITRGEWCKGVMAAADYNMDGVIDAAELARFLTQIGLGAPAGGGEGTCEAGEDMPQYPGQP